MVIKSVALEFPNREDGEITYYAVGIIPCGRSLPVTRIEKGFFYGGVKTLPHHFQHYCQIFDVNGLVAEMYQLGHIQYFEEEEVK
ncbi:MAG: hypothetical protein WC623_24220 [Pedobacter sp.]|uniref:hypothetical protein n=1 Tax=Pedobacter sp. TaxID=1411316 RepID=UPI00356B4D1E